MTVPTWIRPGRVPWAFACQTHGKDSVEARLRELHPSGHSLCVSFGELKVMGCLKASGGKPAEEWGYCEALADAVLARSDAIAQFRQEWKQPAQRLWLSALVGDWFAVSELAASEHMEEIANLAKQRAAECHSQRLARVTAMVAKFIEIDSASLPMPEWFHAIGELDGSQLAKYLRQALAMRDAAFCALRYIEEQDDGTWCPEVYALLRERCGAMSAGTIPEAKCSAPCQKRIQMTTTCSRFGAPRSWQSTAIGRPRSSAD